MRLDWTPNDVVRMAFDDLDDAQKAQKKCLTKIGLKRGNNCQLEFGQGLEIQNNWLAFSPKKIMHNGMLGANLPSDNNQLIKTINEAHSVKMQNTMTNNHDSHSE